MQMVFLRFTFALMLTLVSLGFASAHGLSLIYRWETQNRLSVVVNYDDGEAAENCEIRILDKNKAILATGKTNSDGVAEFLFIQDNHQISTIIADAGDGHVIRKRLSDSDEQSYIQQMRIIKGFVGVGIIGVMFFLWKWKRTNLKTTSTVSV